MNRKAKRALMIAGAIFLGAFVFSYLNGPQESTPATPDGSATAPGAEPVTPATEQEVDAVQAVVNIRKHTRIHPEMIAMTKVPISLRHTDAATEVKQVVDRFALVNIYPKEQVLMARLGETSSADVGLSYVLQRGKRAVSIPITTDRAVGGYISPGMVVDILGTFRGPAGLITKPVMQAAKILAINDKHIVEKATVKPAPTPAPQPGAEQEARKDTGFDVIDNISTVTFETSAEDAERLILASANSQLHLEIVNPDNARGESIPEVHEAELKQLKKPTAPIDQPLATQQAPVGPPQPTIHKYEIIRYKSKETQTVAEIPPTSLPVALLTTSSARPTPAPTAAK
ncbi:MAG: Flp pilus assembly protein CpaB [Candidatus Riflebacteria bacterium]|nr:Flp pilus assembly protein CpaB [Candidatus Riflebacteria bacterium]